MEGPVPSAAGPREGVSTPVTSPPTRGQVSSAWAVHGFTALGIVAAMLALRDILVARPSYAILWLLLTLLIDGVDGPIARALGVRGRAPHRRVHARPDHRLRRVRDRPGLLHVRVQGRAAGQLRHRRARACSSRTSAIWFARRDMMSEDNWFRGFPAAWNLVAPVMFLMEARTSVGAIITLILSVRTAHESAVPAHHAGQVPAPVHPRCSRWSGSPACSSGRSPTPTIRGSPARSLRRQRLLRRAGRDPDGARPTRRAGGPGKRTMTSWPFPTAVRPSWSRSSWSPVSASSPRWVFKPSRKHRRCRR